MPLRILHLTSTRYGIGGVERLLLSAADKYDPSFHVAYCNIFCDKDGEGKYPTALREKHLPFFHVPGKRLQDLPALVKRLAGLLR
nr:hypothetical protein [Acidobacteriota bacterium]